MDPDAAKQICIGSPKVRPHILEAESKLLCLTFSQDAGW